MTGIRSLHIDDQSTWRGGEQQVFYLLKGLKERGHVAELVAQPGSVLGERVRTIGAEVHPIRMRGEADLFAAHRISSLIRAQKYDVIHMHTAHAHTLGCMACAFNPAPMCIVSRRVDFPLTKHPFSFSRIKYRFRVNHFIAISHAVKDVLLAGGVPAGRISVVHSGVEPPRGDIAQDDIRSVFGLSPTSKIVGTVGALVDHKGHRFLIEAAPTVLEKMPEVRFILVGEGELRGDLERRAALCNVENAIIFAGFRPQANALLSQFDVFAAPSHMEGLNTSIIDAMMAARPVVAAKAGGIPELIEHEKTGLLVPTRNPLALAEAILQLLAHPEKARTLALAGQKRAMENFTADRMVEGTIAVYDKLLAADLGCEESF